jgi:hypothetical protein
MRINETPTLSWSENGESAELYSAGRGEYSEITLPARTGRTTEIRFRIVPRPESWLQIIIQETGGGKRRSLKSFSMPEEIGRAFISLLAFQTPVLCK